ncbi:MAG: hypothetical protein K6A23_07200 [Butyrivibrio sp.]|nr:hypothetical protein [Butyrivibrio sp.]
MRKLVFRIFLCTIPVMVYLGLNIYIDTFNIFHYDNIRITSAEPNKNYIKTRYITENPDQYNAFIFGSSRVANIPVDGLITGTAKGEALNWYNMTCSMSVPGEQLSILEEFISSGVDVKAVIIGVDELSMSGTADVHYDDLMRKPYELYEDNKLGFYYDYLIVKPEFSLLPEVLFEQNSESVIAEKNEFYNYGVAIANTDFSLGDKGTDLGVLECGEYTGGTTIEDMKKMVSLCDEEGIELYVFTSPILESTYRNAVAMGYLDFLKDLSTVTGYINFSGLNDITTNTAYYFDSSHYRPVVGLEIENVIFGKETADTDSFYGVRVNNENADDIIAGLELQLQ